MEYKIVPIAHNYDLESHERIVYEKQKLIITDERAHIEKLNIDVFSQPLEMLDGDIYGVIKTQEGALVYIIDCMGKGVSAAVTAVLCAAFLNHSLKLSIEKNDFDFERLGNDFIGYISSYLLEDETLSFTLAHISAVKNRVEYISFGMYPMLVKHLRESAVSFLRSTNPPLMNGERLTHIETYPFCMDSALILYSDGLCELGDINYKEVAQIFSYSNDFQTFFNAFLQLTSIYEIKADDDVTVIFVTHSNQK